MVRAILDGRKTQTRRVIKPQPGPDCDQYDGATLTAAWKEGWVPRAKCPYGMPGDILWVREGILQSHCSYQLPSGEYSGYWTNEKVEYLADDPQPEPRYLRPDHYGSPYMLRRPSIHMPRWASRITLEITDIRVERLQDISEADARAEGCPIGSDGIPYDPPPPELDSWQGYGRYSYCLLWSEINGAGSWAENPWVWAVSFRRVDSQEQPA
jgi:hypothetical protein